MTLQRIYQGIRKAPLTEEVKSRAIAVISEDPTTLEEMFTSLGHSPPTAHNGWYESITSTVMERITPTLRHARVEDIDGTNTFAHIYAAITDTDPNLYLD
jgi:hypothetical protein